MGLSLFFAHFKYTEGAKVQGQVHSYWYSETGYVLIWS